MTALAQLEAALCQAAPHHRSRIRHQLALMDAGLRQFLETYVAHCTQAGASCDDMAESYAFLLCRMKGARRNCARRSDCR